MDPSETNIHSTSPPGDQPTGRASRHPNTPTGGPSHTIRKEQIPSRPMNHRRQMGAAFGRSSRLNHVFYFATCTIRRHLGAHAAATGICKVYCGALQRCVKRYRGAVEASPAIDNETLVGQNQV